jgi:methylmalonyl-CoA/ethylmalonyl-CoA epimerase
VQVLGVHHVAMAVDDLDEAIQTWSRLYGARIELRGRLEEQGVDAAYLEVGSGRVELVSALGPETPVARFLASRGPAMHHVALEVEDIAAAIDELARNGANVLDPEPRRGLGGHAVSFVHPESHHGVLTEVIEHDE